MNQLNKVYKSFEGKKVLIITNSNFKYTSSDFKCLDDEFCSFTDNRGRFFVISMHEIKMIQEVQK
jgi:hypothetical protein